MFRVSQHPSSGVLKTVTAACGYSILLLLVGFLLTLNYDARNRELKTEQEAVQSTFIQKLLRGLCVCYGYISLVKFYVIKLNVWSSVVL